MSYSKYLVCFTIFILVIFASLFYGGRIIDYRSKFQLFSSNATACSSAANQSRRRPLNVYMYDLGMIYNVGMLNGSHYDGPPVTAETLPEFPHYTGLRRQHTVEYWMLASLLYRGNGTNQQEAVRVLNPDSADVFFVPFFSSLSFDTYHNHGNDTGSNFDDQLQVITFLISFMLCFEGRKGKGTSAENLAAG